MPEGQIGPVVENWTAPPPPGPAAMEGRYVRLERLDPDRHAAIHAANAADDAIWRYIPHGPFADEAAWRAWAATAATGTDPFFYAVQDRATGGWGGVLSYLRITPPIGSIELGWITFAPSLQRTRAATEALILPIRWAFEAGYRRFEWKCDALNLPSRRAAERLGLSYEGTFRQATIVKGRNRDTAWFAATDGDWPALRAAYGTWLAPDNFDASGRQRQRLSDLTRPVLVTRDPVLVRS